MSIGLGNDIVIGRRMGVRLSGGGGSSLDADAATLIAAMTTTPDATRQGHINTLITGLKADGVWTKLDELWVTAAHAEQAALLGWKRYKNLTAVNAPTFTVDRGFAGNGTTSYLNTNYVPSTDGVNYTLNDASLGVYSRTAGISGSTLIGAGPNTTIVKIATPNLRGNINGALGSQAIAAAVAAGFNVVRRASSTHVQGWKNGAQIGSDVSASSASLTSSALYLDALNNGGTAIEFDTTQIAAAFVGAAMSEAQQLALYNRIQTYMTAVGANV